MEVDLLTGEILIYQLVSGSLYLTLVDENAQIVKAV